MRSLRVALVYEEFRLDRSLARDRVLIARALTDLGVEVHVYCDPAKRTVDAPGVIFHDVAPLSRGSTRFGRALQYGSFAAAATRRLRAERADYDVVDVAGTTAWEHDVVRAHAVQKAEQRRWPLRGGRDYRLARVRASLAPFTHPRLLLAQGIERLQFRPGHFKRVLAVTEGVKDDLHEIRGVDPDLIRVVPYPVETKRFATSERGLVRNRLGLGSDDLLALFVGHDYERKGLSEAISGVATLDHVSLVVVGEGDPTPYEKAAARLGIASRVHFLGGTGTPETFFVDADVFLLPTREDVWGMSVIEAMSAGVPVIVSEVAGAADVIRESGAGLVVERSSSRGLADALRVVFHDQARAQAMGERGRRAAARFDVVRVAEEVLATYEHVIRASGARPGT